MALEFDEDRIREACRGIPRVLRLYRLVTAVRTLAPLQSIVLEIIDTLEQHDGPKRLDEEEVESGQSARCVDCVSDAAAGRR